MKIDQRECTYVVYEIFFLIYRIVIVQRRVFELYSIDEWIRANRVFIDTFFLSFFLFFFTIIKSLFSFERAF